MIEIKCTNQVKFGPTSLS